MGRPGVGSGVHGERLRAEHVGGADDPHGDLLPVRDQDLAEGRRRQKSILGGGVLCPVDAQCLMMVVQNKLFFV